MTKTEILYNSVQIYFYDFHKNKFAPSFSLNKIYN